MTHNRKDHSLPVLTPLQSQNHSTPTDNDAAMHESSHCLSTHFDAIAEQLFDEMEKSEGYARKKLFSENYLLAAILLQGAQPVLH